LEKPVLKIFLTHVPDMLKNYYGERALAELRKLGEVRLNGTGHVLDAEALAQAARGCEIIVSDRQTAGPAEFFPLADDLVAFLRVAVDIRNVDVAAASAHGILVTHATPGFVAAVAEMAIGFMVDCGRHITEATSVYRTGRAPEARMGRQLNGATLGIVGYGVIGEYLAALGLALGMTVLVTDPYKKVSQPRLNQVQFGELLARSDFVVCLAVANERTENLMNAEAFAQMKSSAFFINLSRGNLVDEAALARVLDENRIAGAALDVGRAQDQMPSLTLARRADVIATPHAAGLTPDAAEHQAFDTVNQVKDLIAGRMPAGAANPQAGRRLIRLKRA
jgi:D-3-phosphoglycerate dehydrogenase / 2-oxoglutarate reductase